MDNEIGQFQQSQLSSEILVFVTSKLSTSSYLSLFIIKILSIDHCSRACSIIVRFVSCTC